MTRATLNATSNPAQEVAPIATTSLAPGLTTHDVSATARGQIEFSLNVLRIASPGEPVSKRLGDAGSARAHNHIGALEELLASIDSHRASEGAA
jgi:hypothetical protein